MSGVQAESWEERIERDQAALRARLSEEQVAALEAVVDKLAADPQLELSFLVVFGSQATGAAHADSDLDIYAEANIPRERGFSIPGYDVLLNPNGRLAGGANLGFEMNREVIEQALVWHDNGTFRLIVSAAEQR